MEAEQVTIVAPSPVRTVTVPKETLDKIVRRHIWAVMGVGLIPAPLIDIAGITGIQLNMVRKLSQAYQIPFSQNTVHNLVYTLLSSVMPIAMTPAIALSVAKFLPFLGQTAGVVTMPLLAGAATYALGKVFIQHFESGGTFLTFDPEKVKAYYNTMFQEGKDIVTRMQNEQTRSAPEPKPEPVAQTVATPVQTNIPSEPSEEIPPTPAPATTRQTPSPKKARKKRQR